MKDFTITAGESGQRFEKYIRRKLPSAGTGFIFRMLRKKNITLNGRKAEGNERLAPGDRAAFYFSDETWDRFAAPPAADGGNHQLKVTGETAVTQGQQGNNGQVSERRSSRRGPGSGRFAANHRDNRKQPASPAAYRDAFRQVESDFGPISIAYEDANILLAVKPVGLLSQKAVPGDLSLNEWLVGYLLDRGKLQAADLSWYTPSVANRLDRNTGGLVLCAKTLPGSRLLSDLLRERTLHKYYQMIVVGGIAGSGVLENWLWKDAATNHVQPVPAEKRNEYPGAAFARTVYQPLERSANGRLTLLEAELQTGRTHQLRAQFSAAGHPILGDVKYGNRAANLQYRTLGVRSQLLYCVRVEFPVLEDTAVNRETGLNALSGRTVRIPVPALYCRVMAL